MPLESGHQLGHYALAEKIGEGGMGEVYRARDTLLDRDVAIKILPAAFAEDPQRLARFERAAKAVAALSHPNILAIYEFGREGHVVYAAMELLEGESLRQVLNRGSLPPRKALEYGRQMANGLAAAHERGVVHRDLKPENVFVTRDSRIKILDFGLARVDAERSGDLTSAPTRAPTAVMATNPGVVMGTAGYMSPEQVRGLPVDTRTDLFALGAILYEMIVGRRAFAGGSPADTMSAILREDPAEITSLAEGLPVGVEPLVLHCLEKNPDERFQSARDLAFNLSALSSHLLPGAVSGAQAAVSGAGPAARRRSGPGWRTLAVAALLAAAATAAAMLELRPAAGIPRVTNTLLTFRRGWVDAARFAPDGQTVVYGAAWGRPDFRIFATQPGSPGSRAIELGRSADLVAISSAGEIALILDRKPIIGMEMAGTLGTVPLQGGAPRELMQDVYDADWGPGGKSLAVVRSAAGRTLLEYPAGQVLYASAGWMSRPRVHPDGRRVAFVDHPSRGDSVGHAAVVNREGQKIDYPGTASGLDWSADGRELWVFDFEGQILAFHEDGSQRVVYSVPLTDGTLLDLDGAGRALMADGDVRREMAGGSRGDPVEQEWSWLNWSSPSGVSADLSTILFDEQGTGHDPEGYLVYVRDFSAAAPVHLAKGVGLGLSPDARWAAVVLDPFGQEQHLQLIPTGIGQARDVDLGGLRGQFWVAIDPAARFLVVGASAPASGMRLYRHDMKSGTTRPISEEGVGLTTSLAMSPDSAWVAATSSKGLLSLYPLDGDDSGGRPVPGARVNERLVAWSAERDIIYVFTPGAPPVQVFRLNLATGERTPWLQVSPADTAGVFNIDRIVMSRDGQRYLYTYRRLLSRLLLLEGLK
ncbi:MAG: protein kinase [Acidobacteriota bacterium]